jgi:RNA polymerase sigma-70 factor (ECF subfamily)
MPGRKPGPIQVGEALTDIQLVRRVLAGEAALFEILVHRHSQRVYRAARAVLRFDDEAADVVQETYLRAFRNLKQFAGQAKFSTWLIKIAIYEARARKRKGRAHGDELRAIAVTIAAWNEPDSDDPEKLALVGEVRRILEAAIDTLPDMYRTVFVMRGVEEMSTADTADCLNLSEDAVKTRLRRARALLRKKLYAAVGPMRREAFRFAGKRCLRMWRDRILPALRSRGGPGNAGADSWPLLF